MFFSIDVHSDVAIYLQLVRQVKFAIAAGTIRPGQLLPSVRALSNQVALNPNTVAGMVVRDAAVEICRSERETVLNERIGSVLAEAWHAGLSKKQIKTFVDDHLRQLVDTEPAVLVSSTEPSDNGGAEE